MSKKIEVLWIFYGRLLVPAGVFSLVMALITLSFSAFSFGIAFLFILPLLHFVTYEARLRSEYVFYANFGFSRIFLWAVTVTIALLVKFFTGML